MGKSFPWESENHHLWRRLPELLWEDVPKRQKRQNSQRLTDRCAWNTGQRSAMQKRGPDLKKKAKCQHPCLFSDLHKRVTTPPHTHTTLTQTTKERKGNRLLCSTEERTQGKVCINMEDTELSAERVGEPGAGRWAVLSRPKPITRGN